MKRYHHLTVFHRRAIGQLLKQGVSKTKIATILGVHRTTIYREFRRNRSGFGYCCFIANDMTQHRRLMANHKRSKLTLDVKRFIRAKLILKLSPEQIASLFSNQFGHTFTAQSIYRHIRSYEGHTLGLRTLLRRKGKRYFASSSRRAAVRNRPSIDCRPTAFSDRSTFGHWEADLMEGARKQAGSLLVLVERKSRYTLIRHVSNKKAASVSKAIIHALRRFQTLSITYDNGCEFASYKSVAQATGGEPFFCHPYHAWEKGTVENTIGLIREYCPKGEPVSNRITEHRKTQNQLNFRPRKTLGFQSPHSLLPFLLKPI
ncbi:IS30 family transposase [Prosthecobacter fluviatilis]|uniref:IS30 family transposase n=1 Tax=Prosthecobacter fluviatilis TaxID=445931 RepID=A0ABW0KY99_9BACT